VIDVDVEPAAAPLAVGDDVTVAATDDLERVDVVRYAGASGDFNPLHVDETAARAAGHDSVFAHGMLLCGVAERVVAGWLDVATPTALRTRFVAPAVPGDAVIVECAVTGRDPVADGTAVDVDVDVAVRNGGGDPLLTGEASARRS
jgi:acyl dehydratase